MRNIVLIVEYDGTDYCGWQIQPNGITVQQCITDILCAIEGKPVQLNGAGRTDAGVHSRGQVANFFTESRIPADKYRAALNSQLPESIRILKSFEADEDFHPRFSAKKKTYKYYIRNSDFSSALTCRYEHTVSGKLDTDKMSLACKYLIGEHDFASFMASGSSVSDTVRIIYDADIAVDGSLITFTVTGNGFLYKMVRLIVGALIEIARGKFPPEYMLDLIEKKQKATLAAPAKGLFMHSIEYR